MHLTTRRRFVAFAITLLAGGIAGACSDGQGRSPLAPRLNEAGEDGAPTLSTDEFSPLPAVYEQGGANLSRGRAVPGVSLSLGDAAPGSFRIYKNDMNWGLRDEHSLQAIGLMFGTQYIVRPVSDLLNGVPAGTKVVLMTPNVGNSFLATQQNSSAIQGQLVAFLRTGGVVMIDMADNLSAAGLGYRAPGTVGTPDYVFPVSCTDVTLAAGAIGDDGVLGTNDDHPIVRGPDGVRGTGDDLNQQNVDLEFSCSAAHGNLEDGVSLPPGARVLMTMAFPVAGVLVAKAVMAEYCHEGGRVIVHTFTTGFPNNGPSPKLKSIYAYSLSRLATCVPPNEAPVAHAGGPYTGDEGTSVALTAAGSTDPDEDALSYAWDLDNDGDHDDATGVTASFPIPDDGSYPVSVKVTDEDGLSSTASATITGTNVAPSAEFSATPGAIDEGGQFTVTLANASDVAADMAELTYEFDCGDGSGYRAPSDASAAVCTTADDGTRTVRARVSDADGGASEHYTGTVAVANVAPAVAGVTAPVSASEGSVIPFSAASVTDPSTADAAAGFSYAFACGAGPFGAFGGANAGSCPAVDDGPLVVRVKAKDKDGAESAERSATVTVTNVPPTLGALSFPTGPVPAGTPVTVSASFTDPGSSDTHTAQVSWDVGAGFEVADVAGGTASATKALPAGVYTVTLKVTDDDGGEDVETTTGYVVVYDASGGFVTGGGWIDSPAGALAGSAAAGKATFGFVSKYLPGRTTPSGNTEFEFKAGGFRFKSASYEWLVVSGARAQYKGEGTVNGGGSYGFLLTAIDGAVSGGGGTDRFRIKVWDVATGAVVYDNQRGAGEDSDASTALGGGSVVIHR